MLQETSTSLKRYQVRIVESVDSFVVLEEKINREICSTKNELVDIKYAQSKDANNITLSALIIFRVV